MGYKPEINSNLEINVYDLPASSHVKIDVICEICKAEQNIRYHKYIENKKRHGFYGCKKCSRQKASLTMLNKYGVHNVSQLEECKKKREETFLKKYGYKTNLISPDYISLIKEKLKEKYNTENWYEIRNGKGSRKKLIIFAETKDYTEISFALQREELILQKTAKTIHNLKNKLCIVFAKLCYFLSSYL